MSVVVRPDSGLGEGVFLTTSAAVAVCRAVEECCGVRPDIKWVNDLYCRGKKVCGILTEAETDFESGAIAFAVIGIGLNIFLKKEEIPEELSGIAGGILEDEKEAEALDRNRLIASILTHLAEELSGSELSPYYIERNIIPGRRIRIEESGRVRYAFAEKICPDGRLLIREADGTESAISFGEISVCEEGQYEENQKTVL